MLKSLLPKRDDISGKISLIKIYSYKINDLPKRKIAALLGRFSLKYHKNLVLFCVNFIATIK